ncbi:hypothetical protein ACFX1X_014282 [Malus domestica]
MMSSSSRRMSSQRRKKKASTTREASTKKVVVEVADVDMDVDVVGTSTTIVTMKEDEAQQKVFRHYASECRAPSNRPDEKVNYVKEEKKDNGIMLLACKNNDGNQDYTWYLDTGASNHMCGRRSMFVELNESVSDNVSFGNESKMPVKGKGNILIPLKNGGHQLISNVYYVPNMKSNILSLGQLLEKGYDIHMKNYSLFLRDDKGRFIAKVKMSKNRMFPMNIQNDVAKCLKICYKDASWLWHLCFGHLNFGGLELLSKKEMVRGLPCISHPDQVAKDVYLGNSSGKAFQRSRPQEPRSHSSSFTPMYAQKSEVFGAFKKFKAAVEKESGCKIKAMRSDRGGEFTSKEFQELCEANGIRRPLTVPRSPQQNGVAERKNRTILNMARSMLKSKRLPKELWAEVVACAVYLSNRSPTRSVGKDSVRSMEWKKTSEKFIFIGYDSYSKGYKLYNPNNGKTVISRDVTFDEEGEWDFGPHAGDLHFFPQFKEENEQGMMEQARKV